MKNRHLFKGLTFSLLSLMLCACGINKEGQYAFMFKLTGNHYGEVLFKGFQKAMNSFNEKSFDKSPSDANVGDQIQMIETLIIQKVKAITVSAAGKTGYDNVLKQANDRGIKVVSVDSPISPKYRVTHIDHCDPKEVGEWLAHASILISQHQNYPVTWLEENPTKGLGDYIKTIESKGKKKFGFLSSTQDSPSQNDWIKYCSEELKNKDFESFVDSSKAFEIKYGNDEPIESKKCANAFIDQKNVDVIIAPTTVAMAAAGQAIKQNGQTNVKLTGLGMPSEMYDYMPEGDEDEFSAPCPYMTMWRVDLFGEIAAAATVAAAKGEYDGKVGSTFKYTVEGDEKTFTTIESDDGGTKVISLDPYPFHKGNIAKWKDVF